MSVRHNLELGRLKRRQGEGVAWSEDKILHFFPKLAARLDTPADFLSGGEQQMVAVARARRTPGLCSMSLRGPPPLSSRNCRTFDSLRGEWRWSSSSHSLYLVLALSDRAYVLERATGLQSGPAAALVKLDLRGRSSGCEP